MYIGKNFLENTLNYINCIPNGLGCLRVGGVRRAFDDLQRIANAVVHLRYGLKTPEHFDFSLTYRGLPVVSEGEHQNTCQQASHKPEPSSMQPVVVDEPLQEYPGSEHRKTRDNRD